MQLALVFPGLVLWLKLAKVFVTSIPNNQLKTDNQRLAVLCLVGYRVYGGLFEFCGIVGSRLARALA
ncbi:hypothetical protein L1D31_21965 [Vibrio sp. Isolate23]|uniref:hypothetical protein n=1 Tax=Vibrio sp. Isolate23 TaxID=2908533 RepID=UPI001EFE4FCB|nr:hypothetical protein [Vibrio sp. Isolate23]MCG9685191.1 hypothetical protein [Vibrio sp. Isolate23]